MLNEKVQKYYDKAYDLNCAETMLYAANDEYNMELKKETLKTMAAFGGGMAIESVCGAITGSLAVLSILFTTDRGHESDRMKNLTKEFFDKFNVALGTDNCRSLKEKYRNNEKRCFAMVEVAGSILEEIILREKNLRLEDL
ncbi:MAG TPA: C-GCAxxG-C-C family (seleno)protein [Clostridiaceae bacterium]